MATRQNQPRSFEARRAERRRRERRRKKRIRALLLLILLIAIIVLVILAFVSCSHKRTENTGNVDATAEVTAEPTFDPLASAAVPTEEPLLPPANVENDLLDIIMDIDARGAEKTAYLTFDDGPSPNVTPSILDTLRRYNVKATFFMLGTSINSYPDLARRVYEEGHLIANHSNGHNYETLYATEESFMNEVQETEDIITRITNNDHHFKLFRFPGGSYNAGDHAAEKQIYKHTLAANGIYHIDWNSLNGDAEGRTKNAQELLEYFKMYLDSDSSTVVLMHDAAAKTATAEGLASIIEYLMSKGYVFKRLDEMPSLALTGSVNSGSAGGTYSGDGAYNSEDTDYADNDDDEDSYDSDYNSSNYSSSSYINSSYNSSTNSSGSNSGSSSTMSTPSATRSSAADDEDMGDEDEE